MCSLMVFPIAPQFNPLCCSQCPPLVTYTGAPKGEESFILGSLHSFNFFLQWANQIVSLRQKKMLDF
jgi:hypothetical protein